jgi:CubicO group peptidase (beta-lactamase class C family)
MRTSRWAAAAGTATALLMSAIPALRGVAQPAPEADVTGLWIHRSNYDVGLHGTLSIACHGTRWQASIGAVNATGVVNLHDIRFAFPHDGGEFRGTLAEKGRVLTGFWVRRAMSEDPRYAAGATQSYAMPVTLHPSGAGRWHGLVSPLQDPFTLFLKIFRDSDGSLKAAFRNPEQNSHGPAMQLTVTRAGDVLRFSTEPDPARPEVHLEARLQRAPDRIELFWSDVNRLITLSRARPEEAAPFYPRPAGDAPYRYREPPATHDGWKTARAGSLGIDEALLARTVQKIIEVDPAGARPWLIHSMAIAYRGRLVLDEYFYGNDRDEPHDTRSAGKTFSSAMLGAVMMGGTEISPQTRLYTLMAPIGPFANPDPRKSQITLAHLMTHTSGLACDDNDDSSPGNEDAMQSQRQQPNWWKFTLDLPMAYEPGTHYAYCSANINLVGAALTAATGEWLPALFDRTVARPLQFGAYYWNLMPNGEGYLGGGAFVRPRDFLKLGQTYLDGGMWDGRRVVPPSWAADSVAPHARISPATTGREGDAFREVYWETDEGYVWHRLEVRSGEHHYPAYLANGNGGQLLIVVPQFDLVVMFTAGNYQQGLWNRERDDIVGGMIIPALPRDSPPPEGTPPLDNSHNSPIDRH